MVDYFAVWQQINEHVLKDPNALKAVFPKEPSYIFSKTGVFLIALSFSIAFVVDYVENQRISEKREKDDSVGIITLILCLIIAIGCVLVIIDINSSYNYETKLKPVQQISKEKSEIERQRQLFKRVIGNKDIKDFYETSRKIENFCKFYYSPQDSNFCRDNKANKYTFNLIFEKKYENIGDSGDLKNAMEYIDKAK